MKRSAVCLGLLLLVACDSTEELIEAGPGGPGDATVDMGDGDLVTLEAGADAEPDAADDGGDDLGPDLGPWDADGGFEMDPDSGDITPVQGWSEARFFARGEISGSLAILGHRVLVKDGHVFATAQERMGPSGQSPSWRLFRASKVAGQWQVDREMTGRDIGSNGRLANALESDGNSLWVGVTDRSNSILGEVWRMPLGFAANPARVTAPAGSTPGFGSAIAVNGRWLVIGDPGPDVNGQGAQQTGAIHIFELVGPEDVVFRQTITSTNPAQWQRFGHTVALAGDRLMVGAPSVLDPTQPWQSVGPSAAYEFVNQGGTWNWLRTHQPTGRGHLRFGLATASTSSTTFLVGASEAYSCVNTCNGASGSPGMLDCPAGLVPCSTVGTVFETGGSQLSELPPENWAVNHFPLTRWGGALSVSEAWLVVGARGDPSATALTPDNDDALLSGAVHLIARNPAASRPYHYLKAADIRARNSFGWDVSIEGTTLAVGAREHGGRTIPGTTGAVYIYEFNE